jgi:hypothetical protein
MQLSPGDGTQPLNPIEVRLYTADRTLSVGGFGLCGIPSVLIRAIHDAGLQGVLEKLDRAPNRPLLTSAPIPTRVRSSLRSTTAASRC